MDRLACKTITGAYPIHVLLSHHEVYAITVALLQISIALGAIAALTRSRLVWYGSVALGATAAVLMALPLFRG